MADAAGTRRRTVIMGAAGRDFHNFNMVYRDDPMSEVIAFTATQIPGIAGRRYPPSLAGALYPEGIPIVDESELEGLCRHQDVDTVVFAYSDVTHDTVMHAGSRALASGADFVLLGPRRTMIDTAVPTIAISAVRTGCGKSQTGRFLSGYLRGGGLRVAVVRHPMPYGDLARQAVERLATREDLARAACTIEEREEYEPHIASGSVVFAGVDYQRVLEAAARDADVILWEGGNNDFPFVRPGLHIALTDALRPGQETTYHPGETVLRMADVVVIAKSDCANAEILAAIEARVRQLRPQIPIVHAASPVYLDDPEAVRGRRVLVVEDGPTITHGGMATGAGARAVEGLAATMVDPRMGAVPEIAAVYARYPHIGPVLPAVGYDPDQVRAVAATIARSDADVVVAATPVDLGPLLGLDKPVVRARYDYADAGEPTLASLVDGFLVKVGLAQRD